MSAPEQPTITSAYRSVGVTFQSLVCNSDVFRKTLSLAASAATKDVAILLLGETGTGKNLIAQAIHNASRRREKPFVSVNCSAIPDTLLEAELFGSEKGAYTSADKLRKGKFELAHGGTLFLDEIGDMSPVAQAKVLRAFEYKQFERVGGEETLHADVRIIAATNRPLEQLLGGGRFREDLFYRMNEFTIEVPPLRARREEIEPLVQAFIRECNERFGTRIRGVDAPALIRLKAHPWPGNVRELRAVIKRACVSAGGETIRAEDLRLSPTPTSSDEIVPVGSDATLAGVEARHIEKVLNQTGWNKKETSNLLGISRPTLDRKISEYNLRKPS
ncbi:MAG: sigma 54-interacting transcriptional regulator [Planctomycetes bacterium]|nr:sigma 54-interacting transcriptional regulator [Planctomycetota bacterium]MCW8137144.1 sigma 54-interacting transcriptional regulator [Planctomycetota bacterium]